MKYGNIKHYKLDKASNIKPGNSCIISGYPCKPLSMIYCILQLRALSDETKAKRIFHDFDKKVYAQGNVENFNSGIIEVSCSTINGMSGSPIVSN